MIKWQRTFKTQASYGILNFNDDIPNLDKVGRFCWEVLLSLKESMASHFAVDFTLVNITHRDVSKSIGYLDTPPLVTMDSPLYITFCIMGKADKYPRLKLDLRQNTKTWHIWGTGNKKYLTLYFGRDQVNKAGMTLLLDQDLRLMYNLIGSLTKNWVVNNIKEFCLPYDGVNSAHRCAQYANKYQTYNQLIDDLPIQLWPYSKTFWNDVSYLFDPRMLPAGFETFWILYLDQLVYLPNMNPFAGEYIRSLVSQSLGNGLSVLAPMARLKVIPRQTGVNLTLLFVYGLRAIGIDVVGTNYQETELSARKYIIAFATALQELPDFNQQFILYVSQSTMQALGQDLYDYGTDVANPFLYLLDISVKQYVDA